MSGVHRARTVLWALSLGVWSPAQLTAQSPEPSAPSPRVYLITVGQGEPVWEKFGHNALWFFDDAAGVDEAYNWGVFDFNQPQFLRRFLTGDTKYWVEQYPGQLLIDFYKRSDRTVVLQRLNFTPDQARRALAYARWNARTDNKYYRYDYFRDNCSTRVRDVIDLALGGSLKRATASVRVPYTHRSESLRLVHDLKLTQLGMDIALAQPADKQLSLWETMFIPMRMRDILRSQRGGGPSGTAPLVAEERTLYTSRQFHERANAPRLWLPYLLVGLLLGVEFAAVGTGRRRTAIVDRVFRIEVTIWAIVTGLLGLVLLLAWTSTRHVFWYRNENLLLLNPLALWFAAMVLVAMRRPRFARQARLLALVIAAASVLALLAKALPWFPQDNLAVILLLLPANVAIAVGLWRASPAPADHVSVDRS